MTELGRSREILDLTNWGQMYLVMIEGYAASGHDDVAAELERLWEQLIICDFDQMDAAEQVEAILSLTTLLMDHAALPFERAAEAWSVLEDDLHADTSRWDRHGPTSPGDRQEWREAIRERLIQLYPDLDPDAEAERTRRLREPPDDASGILY